MSWLSSRQRSILGMISCSSRIACSTRASVEKPVLPRRLRDRPSLSNRIAPSCWGEPIDELLAGQRPDLALEVVRSRRARACRPRRRRSRVEPHARDLHVAQHARRAAARPRPSGRSRPRSSSCSRCQAASACSERRRRRRPGRSTSVARPRSSQISREREAAPRGLEQVGGQQRVVGEVRPAPTPQALASWATTGRSPSAATSSCGPVARADEHLLARGRRRSASAVSARTAGPRGASGATTRDRDLRAAGPQRARRRRRALADARADRGAPRRARGAARRRRRRSASSRRAQRRAQLELAEDLAQLGAVGLARGLGAPGRRRPGRRA